MLMLIILWPLLIIGAISQSLYNHDSSSYRNQTWMTNLDDGVPLRQMTILGTHSSMSTGTGGDAFQTQGSSLSIQLASGIRALDIRCRHYQDSFPIHQRLVYLKIDLGGVLNQVKNFLTSYPRQTVLMHIVQEYSASGNSRSFQETFKSYKNSFSDLIWTPTTQNPTLGMTRGKVVILQNFPGAIHGLLYGSFTSLPHKNYGTNWDHHDRWISIKNFMGASPAAGNSRITFWSGSIGSFPYFCASGKSDPRNNGPRLMTGLTTPIFKSYYPDFPRVGCFLGSCSIAFQGINTLANNYINNNGLNYLGILFVDFPGNDLIQSIINKNNNLFGKCTLTQLSAGCTACSKSGLCIACNDLLHYIFDSQTSSCLAEVGYYLNSTSIPNLCSDVMPGCLQCSSETTCILCDTFLNYKLLNGQCQAADGYYLDSNSIPVKCNILGCYLCSSATVCTNCSSINNFIMDNSGDCICDSSQNFMLFGSVCICTPGLFLSSNGTCQPIPLCPANNSGCLNCSSSVCSVCDAAAGFIQQNPYCICDSGLYYDGVTCQMCNITQPACLDCISSSLCIQCVQNFTLDQGQCICNPQFYQHDLDTCLECSVGCLTCLGINACTICNTSAYFNLIGGLCQCQVGRYVDLAQFGQTCVPCGAMPGCVNCNMAGCIACDAILGFVLVGNTCDCNFGYYIDTVMSLCAQCMIQGCLDCVTQSTCVVCDNTTYTLDVDTGLCLQICGDGMLFNLQCDDNNTVSGDGCSSNCKVQEDFTCSGGNSQNPSACSYSGEVKMTLISYDKVQNQNKVQIKLVIEPNIPIFDQIDYQACIVPNFPYKQKKVKYDTTTGEVFFVFQYDKSLNTNNQMQVAFVPPSQEQFYYTPTTRLQLPRTTDNNLALKAYSPQVYSLMPIFRVLGYVLLGLSIGGFLFGLVVSSKLMGIEMMMVVQLAFIGLISMEKLESLLYCLISIWPVNGYNRLLPDKQQNLKPPRINVVGYNSWFLANFNLNIIIALLPFLVGLAVHIYSKIKTDKQKRKKAYNIYKEWGITMLLFVQLHLVVSIGIGITYGIDQIYGVILGVILCLLTIVETILLVIRPINFGEYKSFFQFQKCHSNFYVFVVLIRFIIAISIVFFSQTIAGLCISLAMLLLELLCLIIMRPYKQNLRPIFNCLVMLMTLAIYLGYKVRIIDQTQWLTTYVPLILLLMLIICVVVNILWMIKHKFCNSEEKDKAILQDYMKEIEQNLNKQSYRNIQDYQLQEVKARIIHGELKQSMNEPKNLSKYIKAQLQNSKQHLREQQPIEYQQNISIVNSGNIQFQQQCSKYINV